MRLHLVAVFFLFFVGVFPNSSHANYSVEMDGEDCKVTIQNDNSDGAALLCQGLTGLSSSGYECELNRESESSYETVTPGTSKICFGLRAFFPCEGTPSSSSTNYKYSRDYTCRYSQAKYAMYEKKLKEISDQEELYEKLLATWPDLESRYESCIELRDGLIDRLVYELPLSGATNFVDRYVFAPFYRTLHPAVDIYVTLPERAKVIENMRRRLQIADATSFNCASEFVKARVEDRSLVRTQMDARSVYYYKECRNNPRIREAASKLIAEYNRQLEICTMEQDNIMQRLETLHQDQAGN
ncbi:MAG: hypothetical protein KDD25_01310 [Bdellovibrionales bacterium]|nr:hypothetical protein [Bdellovibrionales bacterium]